MKEEELREKKIKMKLSREYGKLEIIDELLGEIING